MTRDIGTENSKPSYKIGRGRPPTATQFKKGVSGNPKGSRKAATNIAEILKDTLKETTVVLKGGRKRKVSNQKAMLTSIVNSAILGDLRALNEVQKLMARVGLLEPLPDLSNLHGVFALTPEEMKDFDSFPDRRLTILLGVRERDAIERLRIKQLNPHLRL